MMFPRHDGRPRDAGDVKQKYLLGRIIEVGSGIVEQPVKPRNAMLGSLLGTDSYPARPATSSQLSVTGQGKAAEDALSAQAPVTHLETWKKP